MKKKILVPAVASLMLLSCMVGGTLAYLFDDSETVTNTFTVGDVNITLHETKDLNLKMVPGITLRKDPIVTVVKESEDCWLFVKVQESDNLTDFIEYTINEDWSKISEENDGIVYAYKEVVKYSDSDQTFEVLTDSEKYENGQVVVKTTVTKEMMDALSEADATQPTLTFTAYAVQALGFNNSVDAWNEYKNPTAETTAATPEA